jgi:competence protein ComEC
MGLNGPFCIYKMLSRKTILIILLFANIVSWSFIYDLTSTSNLEVCFFDVGQGDSILIKAGDKQILIDGGPNNSVVSKLSKKMPLFDKQIDLVVLTHPHHDHLNGLLNVFEKFKVSNFLFTGEIFESKNFNILQDLILKEGSKKYIAKLGLRIIISKDQYIDVLYPFESLNNQLLTDAKANDSSVILKLYSFNDTMLFTGDATFKTESDLVEKGIDIRSDVLKVAHHGSKYATTDFFLHSVLPKLAAISVGENNTYNQPAIEMLDRLEKDNIKVVRTDKNGDICLTQKKTKQFSLSSQME